MGTFIKGKPASAEAAMDRAAAVLAGAARPLVSGLDVDIAAAGAAIRLAARLGGAIDHAGGARHLHGLRALQDAGGLFTTPAEAARRADLLVIAGPSAAKSAAVRHVLATAPDSALAGVSTRITRRLCAKPAEGDALDDRLALLAGLVRGNPVRGDAAILAPLRRLAETMRAARFGVLAWSEADMDAVTIELVGGLIGELNAKTRFAALPATASDSAAGLALAMGWSTGFPYRTGFGHGFPEHDAWRFDGARLMAAGECDAVLWVSTLGEGAARPDGPAPVVAVVSRGAKFPRPPEVLIEVGRPGVDHDGELYDGLAGGLVACPARKPDASLPAASDVLETIALRIGGGAC